MMCPHAEVVRGRAVALDEERKSVAVETDVGPVELQYERLVVALGSITRMLPIPGLEDHGIEFKSLPDAIYLRNHLLRNLERVEADPDNAERYLTFVFVGAGFAGVEALAEVIDLVSDAHRHYPSIRDTPHRWVLVDAGTRVLAEVPDRLGEYAEKQLRRRSVDIRLETTLERVDSDAVLLSDGTRLETDTLVWTAGVTPNPVLGDFGLPLDERGRVLVDHHFQVDGRSDVWAIGDCARVPSLATPDVFDPPTCQHALRQARRLVKTLRGKAPKPYRYKSLGQGATLGKDKGIANAFGMRMRGVLGGAITRAYHLHQIPLFSRRIQVLTDGTLSAFFRRDMTEMGLSEPLRRGSRP
jgi:NADH:quinone reductase (non-electrogenic)